jgi:hypothetical protein
MWNLIENLLKKKSWRSEASPHERVKIYELPAIQFNPYHYIKNDLFPLDTLRNLNSRMFYELQKVNFIHCCRWPTIKNCDWKISMDKKKPFYPQNEKRMFKNFFFLLWLVPNIFMKKTFFPHRLLTAFYV